MVRPARAQGGSSRPAVRRSAAGESLKLRLQLLERGGESGKARLLLIDHRLRSAGHEASLASFGLRLGDLAFEPCDLLPRRSRSAAMSISTLSIKRVEPTTETGAISSALISATTLTSESLASPAR